MIETDQAATEIVDALLADMPDTVPEAGREGARLGFLTVLTPLSAEELAEIAGMVSSDLPAAWVAVVRLIKQDNAAHFREDHTSYVVQSDGSLRFKSFPRPQLWVDND